MHPIKVEKRKNLTNLLMDKFTYELGRHNSSEGLSPTTTSVLYSAATPSFTSPPPASHHYFLFFFNSNATQEKNFF